VPLAAVDLLARVEAAAGPGDFLGCLHRLGVDDRGYRKVYISAEAAASWQQFAGAQLSEAVTGVLTIHTSALCVQLSTR